MLDIDQKLKGRECWQKITRLDCKYRKTTPKERRTHQVQRRPFEILENSSIIIGRRRVSTKKTRKGETSGEEKEGEEGGKLVWRTSRYRTARLPSSSGREQFRPHNAHARLLANIANSFLLSNYKTTILNVWKRKKKVETDKRFEDEKHWS